MPLHYRQLQENEYSFLVDMLYEALFVPPGQPKFPASIVADPAIKQYVYRWNKNQYDIAIVAVDEQTLVGAIWGRKFGANNKGYGFVDEDTPEISMAIKAAYRNRGIGTQLLSKIEIAYAKLGVTQLSLSVDKRNPVVRLYERCGYEVYATQAMANTMWKKIKLTSYTSPR